MAINRNGFQHKLMDFGMKNLGVQFLYRIKFQLLDGTPYNNENSKALADRLNTHQNTDADTNAPSIDFIYFSRGISGLPKFEVDPIKDNFFIYTQQVPGKPKNDFGPLTIDLIVKETGEPIIEFIREINKLVRLQGKDMFAKDGTGVDINNYADVTSADYADANVQDVFASYDAAEFANNSTKNIFFNMTVSALEYGTYKPWMTYKFNNCWISKVDIGDSLKETQNELVKGKLNVTYDFPEILFYKNANTIPTDDTSATS